jgi:hypothetical protein
MESYEWEDYSKSTFWGVQWDLHNVLLFFQLRLLPKTVSFWLKLGFLIISGTRHRKFLIFFKICLFSLNAACKCRKVVIHVAVMYFFITKHGENRAFWGQIIEIFKWSPFIIFISHKCNQITPQPQKIWFCDIHEIIILVQLQLQLQIGVKVKFESLFRIQYWSWSWSWT